MQVPADDRGSGFEELRRAAPVPPSTHGGATSRSGELNDGPSPNPGGPSRSAQEREKLDEKLFSEDPRKQYAAFKELSESAKTITKRNMIASTTFAGRRRIALLRNWARSYSEKNDRADRLRQILSGRF